MPSFIVFKVHLVQAIRNSNAIIQGDMPSLNNSHRNRTSLRYFEG